MEYDYYDILTNNNIFMSCNNCNGNCDNSCDCTDCDNKGTSDCNCYKTYRATDKEPECKCLSPSNHDKDCKYLAWKKAKDLKK